jgi:hypothetical protein
MTYHTAIVFAITVCATLGSADPDTAGIAALRQRDIAATLTQDPDQLTGLWDSDATLLGEGERPIVGRATLRASCGRKCTNRRCRQPPTR